MRLLKPEPTRQWKPVRRQNWNNRFQHFEIPPIKMPSTKQWNLNLFVDWWCLRDYGVVKCQAQTGSIVMCLRWLPTVLAVSTPEEGWRTKNEVFVSNLGLSSWYLQWRLATHLGFHFRSYVSVLQTVAMATNSRKDSRFFAIFHLFASFSRVNLDKISWNSAAWWKRFQTIL